jgi:phenylalanyl-tRNA synthetase beta chain
MKVSLSWLREYVSWDMPAKDLADRLTMAGLEVEGIEDRYDYLKNVKVGKILNISPHPNADKLRLCQVDIGENVISLVCGATNISKGQIVPTALPGTIFPNGKVLEKGVIRGEKSEGMLCSEKELGLGDDASGIMILDASLSVGDSLKKAMNLSDMVFEIGLTPNRSDCTSIIGIAREVAAIAKTSLNYPEIKVEESGDSVENLTSVEIKTLNTAPDMLRGY